MRPNFKRAKWANLKCDLRKYQNAPEDQPSTMYDKFVGMIEEVKGRHIPTCKPRKNKHRLPWMKGAGMRIQRTTQWRSWRKFRQTGHPRDYDAYKMERNRLTDMVRMAKAKYERQLIFDMKENPNLYHGHCHRTLKTKQGVTNVVGGDGTLTETENQTAEELNRYYHSVFTRDEGVMPPPDFPETTREKLLDVNFSVETVEKALLDVKPNKAAGPDGVESRIMKECAEELAPLLHQIYRKSLDEAEVPRLWKEAEIVPIHKGGSKAVMANFRPVALTSIMCKVLEKILCSAILAFLTTHNLIMPQQHGFVRGRSCQTNILLCPEKWTELIDSGKSVDVAYFDYTKAFDKVSHRLLLVKLKANGIDGKLLAWLEAWLSDRKQRVVVGNSKSSQQRRISASGLETTSPQPLTCTRQNAKRWLKSVASGRIFPTSTRGRSVRSTI